MGNVLELGARRRPPARAATDGTALRELMSGPAPGRVLKCNARREAGLSRGREVRSG
ncbi:hypothetical protein [Bradyrhizobium sp. USDA 3458]|uniref:hypothetical protein n=1 Tax=Bradyrhizobium sp. USDA 3458 TaxID=2591461 RepID=UPI00132FC17B|nr:hypothetical protein [Bradyrhizobium sp. USDA 3458]